MIILTVSMSAYPPWSAELICIGSLLGYYLTHDGTINPNQKLNIFGSGFSAPPEGRNEGFKCAVDIHALRGKFSKQRCEKILGTQLNDIALGDPGLLVSRMFDVSGNENVYDVGIIPHYADVNSPHIRNIKLHNKSCRIIDITGATKNVAREISQCGFILSSAMHGLICADSLGVPNKHIILSNKVIGGEYKFKDYYSVFNRANYSPVNLQVDNITDGMIDNFKDEYSITSDEINNICNDLEAAFQKFLLKYPIFPKVGRNEPCPCGSGKKYKKCHG